MYKDGLTDGVQKNLRRRIAALHCGENGHPQMLEGCVHLTMGPHECVHGGSMVFVSELFESHARYVELQDVDGLGKNAIGSCARSRIVTPPEGRLPVGVCELLGQRAVDKRNSDRPFTDCRCHALEVAAPNVTHGEHARK